MVGAEIFLSGFLQVLFERLTPHARDLWNLARREGLEKKLEVLVKLFRTVEAVLADAEEKQLTEHGVKIWLDDLRDLAYDTEDVLDKFSTEAKRLKVIAKQQATSTSMFLKLVPARYTPSAAKFNIKMESEMDTIVSRLKEISKRKDQLCLVENGGGASRSTNTWKAIPTTSSPIETVVYGRDKDKENVIALLIRNEQSCDVIPIVAMGGAGKTTLAQHVYRDRAVSQAFQVKAWVCVSNDFDIKRVMKAIIEDLTSQPCELEELQPIQARLEGALAGKRFLIMLDDIWDYTFRYDKWLALKSLFRVGASGSKMIVTTRQMEVATKMGTTKPYVLKTLSDEDCWLLFENHAFNKQHVDLHPNLGSIREMIVAKCKGLPLAARTLGSLLRCKPTNEWEDILNNKIWSMHGDVLPVLRLSYQFLPPQLKKCFVYCAIFPQDYEFTEEELVLLWIAEGLIQQVEENKQVIQEGYMYFRELVSRSLFQASSNRDSKFIMHDLVHELAQQVGGEIYFRLDDVSQSNAEGERIRSARHSSYITRYYDISRRFEVFRKAERLRTFLAFQLQVEYDNYRNLANSVLHLMPQLKKLRVLSFNGYKITELPDSIGSLKHLRYLDLSRTKIRWLPESACLLYNLQILLLRDCQWLQKLPSKMENFTSLSYLDITNAHCLQEMPIGLKELKSLQVLSNFIVGKGNGCKVKELINFKDLCGTICISHLENVVDAKDAKDASLNEKKNLQVLVLEWSSGLGDSRNVESDKFVLDMLQPNRNLKELTIRSYGGNSFSTWLGDPSFSSMKTLKLENCERCTCLPPLGQLPSLKILEISGMHGVKNVGAEFYGSTHPMVFPSLESLSFMNMSQWENWSSLEINEQVEGWFSCLSELSINLCPKLLGNLPNHLLSLKKLVVLRCEKLNISLSNFPKLCELNIDGCQDITSGSTLEFTQVKQLEICGKGCEELIHKNVPCSIEYLIMHSCQTIKRLPMTFCSLTHLRELRVDGCSSLVSLPSALFSLVALEIVFIHHCDNLRNLLDKVDDGFNSRISSTAINKKLYVHCCSSLERSSMTGMLPASLGYLSINECPKLEFVAKRLPASLTYLRIKLCSGLVFAVETFMENPKLETLIITKCKNFQWLPAGMYTLNHLKYIRIEKCPNFMSFPQDGLPDNNLKELIVNECRKVEALPNDVFNITSLENLEIRDCEKLNFFPREGSLTNLTRLVLNGYHDKEQIPMNLPISLTELKISNFANLVSVLNLPIYLAKLKISNCAKLMSLPNLPICLTKLKISNCAKLTSLPNLPIALSILYIHDCPLFISSLKLPVSLIELHIGECQNLKYLSSNFFRGLASLQTLEIRSCPKLKSLPKDGLPSSLLVLYIDDCPLLKKRCTRDKGKDWHKIADIPRVMIDGKFIYV